MGTFAQLLRFRYPQALITTIAFLVSPGCGGKPGRGSCVQRERHKRHDRVKRAAEHSLLTLGEGRAEPGCRCG
jgi:hypothetical protein